MTVRVIDQPLNPIAELQRHQDQALDQPSSYGATAIFVGTMRDFNDGATVTGMTLEHYPGMTEKHLQMITDEARHRWDILDTLIVHRVGELQPNDPIVLVAVWSAHRGPAFDACRYLIEELKSRAPFWKRERVDDELRWVRHNTPGV